MCLTMHFRQDNKRDCFNLKKISSIIKFLCNIFSKKNRDKHLTKIAFRMNYTIINLILYFIFIRF